jgi:hypothetical protein
MRGRRAACCAPARRNLNHIANGCVSLRPPRLCGNPLPFSFSVFSAFPVCTLSQIFDRAPPSRSQKRGISPLLKLFPKLRELLPQLRHLTPQLRNLPLQPRHPPALNQLTAGTSANRLAHTIRREALHISTKQMHVPQLLSPRPPRQPLHQRRLARHQFLQSRLHVAQLLKMMQPLPPPAYLPRRLCPAQQQHAQNRNLRPRKIESLAQAVLVLPHPAIIRIRRPRQFQITQAAQSRRHRLFVKIHDRLAIRLLVASIHQRMQ